MHTTAIWKFVIKFNMESFNFQGKRLFVQYNTIWGANRELV